MNTTRALVTLAFAAAFTLAACGDDDADDGATQASDAGMHDPNEPHGEPPPAQEPEFIEMGEPYVTASGLEIVLGEPEEVEPIEGYEEYADPDINEISVPVTFTNVTDQPSADYDGALVSMYDTGKPGFEQGGHSSEINSPLLPGDVAETGVTFVLDEFDPERLLFDVAPYNDAGFMGDDSDRYYVGNDPTMLDGSS